ncbi:hypothetical protein [Bordetella bronchialis]|nr:hypothetical protein [Bordetella bronchialis]
MPDMPSSMQFPSPLPSVVAQPAVQAGSSPMSDAEQASLAHRVDAVRDAATQPAALQKLASAILDNERVSTGMRLAALLYPPASGTPCAGKPARDDARGPGHDDAPAKAASPELGRMERLWREHVSFNIPNAETVRFAVRAPIDTPTGSATAVVRVSGIRTSTANVSPAAPRGLLEFASDYLRDHPAETPATFLSPFKCLAERGIDIPSDIDLAFRRQVLPYEVLRERVATYVAKLPPRPAEAFTVNVWNSYTFWELGLDAMCSRAAMALLDGGVLTPEALREWSGFEHGVQNLAPGHASRAPESGAPPKVAQVERSKAVTMLLADWTVAGSNQDSARKLALIKDPARLLALSEHMVPFEHIAYLVSLADKVEWPVLAAEMDRVAAQHAPLCDAMFQTLQARRGLSDEEALHAYALQRVFFYNGRFRRMGQEETARLEQSRQILAPHVLRHTLMSSGMLDAWALTRGTDAAAGAPPHFRAIPAAPFFDAWTAQGIPVEQQALIAQFWAQGFPPAFAQDVVREHAQDPIRLHAWFAQGHQARLGHRLDKPMMEAVARWLRDASIPPEALQLVPKMILSDLDSARIDTILHMSAYPQRAEALFGEKANTPWQVWCGLTTPAALYERIVDGNEPEEELREAAEREQQAISDLRRNLAETRERLRHMLHALESVRADIAPDTPHARKCKDFADAWRDTIARLDGLLQPSLDDLGGDEARRIDDDLAVLSAQLSFQITSLDGAPADRASMMAA